MGKTLSSGQTRVTPALLRKPAFSISTSRWEQGGEKGRTRSAAMSGRRAGSTKLGRGHRSRTLVKSVATCCPAGRLRGAEFLPDTLSDDACNTLESISRECRGMVLSRRGGLHS